MIIIYDNNNIKKSPIKSVLINDDQGITVYGVLNPRDSFGPCITRIMNPRDSHLYCLFDFIAKAIGSRAVTTEIENAIQTFFAQYIPKLEKKASKRYDEMTEVITQKSKEAQQEQKKLLVLLGERHYETDPQCGQLLALDICQKLGITNLLIERPSLDLDNVIKPSLQDRANIRPDFLLNIMSSSELQQDISLHPIDPLRDDFLYNKISGLTRNKAINGEILKIGQDAMCVVGANHIPHIITDPEISKIYKFATFYNDESLDPITDPKMSKIYTSFSFYNQSVYDKKSPQELNNLLKSQESLALECDLKSQELIKKVQDMENDHLTKYNTLPNWNEKHPINDLTKQISTLKREYFGYMSRTLAITKLLRPQEMSNISIMDNRVASIPSALDAIDIAINVISANNKESKLLNVLKNQKVWFQKIEDIISFSPWQDEYMRNMYVYLSTGYNDRNYENKLQNVLSVLERFDQTLITDPVVDLIGNWDAHPDC